MKIIAIDPGYDRCGVALLEKKPSDTKEVLVYSDCIETSSKDPFIERLTKIGEALEDLIKKERPEALSIEKLFFNTNQKTATNVSEVRGMILYIAKHHGLEVYEYTPIQIKVAITGYGRSSKSQVTSMLPRLLTVTKKITRDDEWDAIAIGLTCFAHQKFK